MSNAKQMDDLPVFHEQTWDLAYRHSLGKTVGEFFLGLTEGKIIGRKCPDCGRVLVPARSFCDRCHAETTVFVEIGNRGSIEMFTVVYEPFRGLPTPPYAIAYVLLEGASTALLGYLKGPELADPSRVSDLIKVGMPVEVKFSLAEHPSVRDYWFELS